VLQRMSRVGFPLEGVPVVVLQNREVLIISQRVSWQQDLILTSSKGGGQEIREKAFSVENRIGK
jgi:hypothetical protein